MKKIKLCVIGAGDHARRFIYPSLNTIPDLEIVAVCTRTAATAQAGFVRLLPERFRLLMNKYSHAGKTG